MILMATSYVLPMHLLCAGHARRAEVCDSRWHPSRRTEQCTLGRVLWARRGACLGRGLDMCLLDVCALCSCQWRDRTSKHKHTVFQSWQTPSGQNVLRCCVVYIRMLSTLLRGCNYINAVVVLPFRKLRSVKSKMASQCYASAFKCVIFIFTECLIVQSIYLLLKTFWEVILDLLPSTYGTWHRNVNFINIKTWYVCLYEIPTVA